MYLFRGSLESSSAIVTFVFIAQAIRYYGNSGSVIYTVIMNWTLIAVNLVIGVSEAAQPLVSLSYGMKDEKGLTAYLRYSVLFALLLGVLFELVGYGFTPQLVTVFANDDPELIQIIIRCMRMHLPAFLLMGFGICIGSYFQASGKAARSFVIMTLRGIILPVAFAFLFPVLFGTASLWLATPAAELVTSCVAILMSVREASKSMATP